MANLLASLIQSNTSSLDGVKLDVRNIRILEITPDYLTFISGVNTFTVTGPIVSILSSAALETGIEFGNSVGVWRAITNALGDLKIKDVTSATVPFTIEQAAGDDSLVIDALGDILLGNNLVLGDVGDRPLFTLQSVTSNLIIAMQDGTARATVNWNATQGPFPLFITGGEDAQKLSIDSSGNNAVFKIEWSDGQAALAGDAVVYTELFQVNKTDITYKGASLNPPTAKCELITPPALLTGGAWQSIIFAGETTDTDTMHDNVVNPARITINTAGAYILTGYIDLATVGVGYPLYVRILKNGVTSIRLTSTYLPAAPVVGPGTTPLEISFTGTFSVGTYLELQAQTNTNKTIVSAGFEATQIQR